MAADLNKPADMQQRRWRWHPVVYRPYVQLRVCPSVSGLTLVI